MSPTSPHPSPFPFVPPGCSPPRRIHILTLRHLQHIPVLYRHLRLLETSNAADSLGLFLHSICYFFGLPGREGGNREGEGRKEGRKRCIFYAYDHITSCVGGSYYNRQPSPGFLFSSFTFSLSLSLYFCFPLHQLNERPASFCKEIPKEELVIQNWSWRKKGAGFFLFQPKRKNWIFFYLISSNVQVR